MKNILSAPMLEFTPLAWEKLQLYLGLSSREISGFGLVEEKGEGFIVTDVFILKQQVTHTSTEINQDAVLNLLQEMVEKEIDPSKVKLWWHSHASMKPFLSTTDEGTLELLVSNAAAGDFMFAVVGNTRGEVKAYLAVEKPHLLLETDTGIDYNLSGLWDEVAKSIEQNVKQGPVSSFKPLSKYSKLGGFPGFFETSSIQEDKGKESESG